MNGGGDDPDEFVTICPSARVDLKFAVTRLIRDAWWPWETVDGLIALQAASCTPTYETTAGGRRSGARCVDVGEGEICQGDPPPKAGDGEVEMIRHLKIARDTALKSRTQAIVTLRALLINAPQPLREHFIAITGRMTLIRGLAAMRPGAMILTTASAKAALRALARRWLALDTEIREHDAALEKLVRERAPALMAAPGVSMLTVAEMLVVLGDNPERLRSGAAFAKRCGVCPIPASSGKTTRHRLNRGGNRRANAALYRVAITRMRCHPPTLAYVQRRTAEGKSPREIRRCLKRYIAREIFGHFCVKRLPATHASEVP